MGPTGQLGERRNDHALIGPGRTLDNHRRRIFRATVFDQPGDDCVELLDAHHDDRGGHGRGERPVHVRSRDVAGFVAGEHPKSG